MTEADKLALLAKVAKTIEPGDCIEVRSWPSWAVGDEPEGFDEGCGTCAVCLTRKAAADV